MPAPLPPHVLARHDLISFVRLMRPDLKIPKHWVLMASWLERLEAGKETRLIFEVPVRHGKSELCHKLYPAWYLGRNPTRQIMSATHKDSLAGDCGRDIRRYVGSPEFAEVFPGVSLAPDSKAAGRFHIRKEGVKREGVLTTVGRRGEAAGRGADLLIPDDLLGEKEAYSAAAVEEARVMLRSLRTRLQPGGAIVMIQSRVSEEDPVAYALDQYAKDGWKRIRLPALAEQREEHEMPDGTTWVREEGEALWPDQWPKDVLEKTRDQTPIWEWSSRYQQRPIPIGSRVVEESWFAGSRYDDAPADLLRSAHRIVVSVDTSEGVEGGAETAIELFAELPRGSHLIEVQSERWGVPEQLDRVRAICAAHRPHVVLIEKKSTGPALIQQLRADSSFRTPIEAITPPPGLDKVARFCVETPYMKAGKLWLPRKNHPACAHWQPKFERELFSFPSCPQKDQSDALSQFLAYLRRSPTPSYRVDPGGEGGWIKTLERASGGYTDDIEVF